MPDLPVPGSLEDRMRAVQAAIASGDFDPQGANSTTFKYGTGSGDLLRTKAPPPTSAANFLLAYYLSSLGE